MKKILVLLIIMCFLVSCSKDNKVSESAAPTNVVETHQPISNSNDDIVEIVKGKVKTVENSNEIVILVTEGNSEIKKDENIIVKYDKLSCGSSEGYYDKDINWIETMPQPTKLNTDDMVSVQYLGKVTYNEDKKMNEVYTEALIIENLENDK